MNVSIDDLTNSEQGFNPLKGPVKFGKTVMATLGIKNPLDDARDKLESMLSQLDNTLRLVDENLETIAKEADAGNETAKEVLELYENNGDELKQIISRFMSSQSISPKDAKLLVNTSKELIDRLEKLDLTVKVDLKDVLDKALEDIRNGTEAQAREGAKSAVDVARTATQSIREFKSADGLSFASLLRADRSLLANLSTDSEKFNQLADQFAKANHEDRKELEQALKDLVSTDSPLVKQLQDLAALSVDNLHLNEEVREELVAAIKEIQDPVEKSLMEMRLRDMNNSLDQIVLSANEINDTLETQVGALGKLGDLFKKLPNMFLPSGGVGGIAAEVAQYLGIPFADQIGRITDSFVGTLGDAVKSLMTYFGISWLGHKGKLPFFSKGAKAGEKVGEKVGEAGAKAGESLLREGEKLAETATKGRGLFKLSGRGVKAAIATAVVAGSYAGWKWYSNRKQARAEAQTAPQEAPQSYGQLQKTLAPFGYSKITTLPGQATYASGRTISHHHGVDFRVGKPGGGDPVRWPVPAEGEVERTGYDPNGYGNYVRVKMDDPRLGVVYLGHFHRVAVHKGDRITQGTLVGIEGATGRVTGPHLHFEPRGGILGSTSWSKAENTDPSKVMQWFQMAMQTSPQETTGDAVAEAAMPVVPQAKPEAEKSSTPVASLDVPKQPKTPQKEGTVGVVANLAGSASNLAWTGITAKWGAGLLGGAAKRVAPRATKAVTEKVGARVATLAAERVGVRMGLNATKMAMKALGPVAWVGGAVYDAYEGQKMAGQIFGKTSFRYKAEAALGNALTMGLAPGVAAKALDVGVSGTIREAKAAARLATRAYDSIRGFLHRAPAKLPRVKAVQPSYYVGQDKHGKPVVVQPVTIHQNHNVHSIPTVDTIMYSHAAGTMP